MQVMFIDYLPYARHCSKVLRAGIPLISPRTCLLCTSCHGELISPEATLAFVCTLVHLNSYSDLSFWPTGLHNLCLLTSPPQDSLPLRPWPSLYSLCPVLSPQWKL